jgi:protoporphyrinogen oxidase
MLCEANCRRSGLVAPLLRHTKLLCVNMVIDKQDLTKNHWCYIYDQDIGAARVSFPSNLAPTSVEGGHSTLQGEVFRRDDED